MSSLTLAEPLTPAWFEQRRKGIGASEIAAVMGISPWESPFSLYWRKVNGWEFEPSAEMEWGNRLEPVVADKFADAHPELYLDEAGLVEGPEPWMLATPDRFVRYHCTCPMGADRCRCFASSRIVNLLELKTAHRADEWGEPGSDEVPVHYRAQVLWQMLATGTGKVFVAVLIGGSDYREYVVERDDRDIRVMVEHGRRFMARLEAGDPPPLDEHTATLATMKRLNPELIDETVVVPEDVAEGYLRAVRMQRLAERLVDRYETQVRHYAGSAKRIESWSGRKVATHVITDVAESTVTRAAHRRDYLLPPRERKP